MRRGSYIWAFLVATVLGLHGRTRHVSVIATSSAAAPADHNVFVESASLCEILLVQFHGRIQALLPTPIPHEFRSVHTRQVAELIHVSPEPSYSPIRRRPPPSFS
jgi:hypothetical protein